MMRSISAFVIVAVPFLVSGCVQPASVHLGTFGPTQDGVRVVLQAARSSVEKGELSVQVK